jgi:hypothetical protein
LPEYEQGGLGSFAIHGFVGDARQLAQAKSGSQAKREYKIEQLKELAREGDSFGWTTLTGENAMRMRSFDDKAERFLAQYYDDVTVQRFKKEGVQVLHELLKELLEQSA